MTRISTRIIVAVLALLLSVALRGSVTATTFRTVALLGQPAPGLSPSVFTDFHLPMLDNAGRTGFHAMYGGSQSVWSESSGSLTYVARNGLDAPGTPLGTRFNSFNGSTPLVDYNNGHTAFRGFLTGTASGDGIWSTQTGALGLVTRKGLRAPGTPNGVTFESFVLPRGSAHHPRLNSAGQTAFAATLTGTGVNTTNDEGIWAERNGTLNLVARAGSQAPGTAAGVQFSFFDPDFSFNDAAQTAFLAELTGTGLPFGNNEAIFSEGSGTLALVARRGLQAPGTPAGVVFEDLNEPALNSAGHVAFNSTLDGAPTSSNRGIWSNRSGALGIVVLSGSLAPGYTVPHTFTGFDMPVMNAAGELAFRASAIAPGQSSNEGLWVESAGAIAQVAREGEHAVGLTDGITFASFSPPMMNAAGQTAFWARVVGPGITTTTDQGLWATGPAGRLNLIAAEGQSVEVEQGVFRTVTAIYLYTNTGNEDGRRSSFNDNGQITFMLTFTDGSRGVFVSDQVVVPEPAFLHVIALGLAVLGSRFRQAMGERSSR